MTRALAATGLLMLGTVVWAFRLSFGETPWQTSSGTLAGSALVVLASIAVVGMLVAASRWARRLGIVVAVTGAAVAIAGPVDLWWWVGLAASVAALGALAGTTMRGHVRERPAAAGPAAEPVVLVLLLLAAPAVSGLASPAGVTAVDIGASLGLAVAGAWYAKAAPGSLIGVRGVVPILTLVAAVAGGWPEGLATAVLGLVATWLGWTSAARLAVRPLVETGTLIRMPPELTPKDVLDAAGLDKRGRRKDEQ